MSTPTPPSVAGGWLGTYRYLGTRRPVRFEATFTMHDGSGGFAGSILDDGPLGEATVQGTQQALAVRWTKTYVKPQPGATRPVTYQGLLSEDGRRMSGTWRLPGLRGTWEAHRLWSAEVGEEIIREEEAPAGVRP